MSDEPAAVIVAEEVAVQAPLFKRLAAEFFGAMIFIGIGTGAVTVFLSGQVQRVATLPQFDPSVPGAQEQADFFRALLDNSFGDLLPVAIAFAFGLAAMIYAFGGTSGGHFNPAVTLGLAIVRRFRWLEVLPYWIAQCAGATVGALVVAGIYGQDGASSGGVDILFGATTIADGVGQYSAILAEAFIAFILMTAIMGVAVDRRAPKGWSGLVIGIALGGGILVTGAATGGSANFARSLGPFVAALFFDTGSIPWSDLIVYAAGPVIGAAAAALLYESITGLERIAPAPDPGAATTDDAEVDIVVGEPASRAE